MNNHSQLKICLQISLEPLILQFWKRRSSESHHRLTKRLSVILVSGRMAWTATVELCREPPHTGSMWLFLNAPHETRNSSKATRGCCDLGGPHHLEHVTHHPQGFFSQSVSVTQLLTDMLWHTEVTDWRSEDLTRKTHHRGGMSGCPYLLLWNEAQKVGRKEKGHAGRGSIWSAVTCSEFCGIV